MNTKKKAKRRLSDFNFEVEGAHVALVGPAVGSGANEWTVLTMKATNDIPEEIVKKATEVQVTMDFEEFLVRWFNMYYEDAEVLAKLLGMEKEIEPSDMYDYQGEHRKYIEERVAAIQIMKSIYASQDVKKAFNDLSYEDSLSVIEAQAMLEKIMSSVEEGKNVPVTKGQAKPSTNGDIMSQDMIQKALHEELVAKAVQEVLTKASKEKAQIEEVLKSVQAELEVFKAKEKEAVIKARKDALAGVVAEDQVEEMFKATEALDNEAFDTILKTLSAKTKALEESEMFKETGVSGTGEDDPAEKDGTAAILKAKYAKKR